MLIIRICFGLSGAGISVISDKVMENLLALFSMTEKAQVTAENEVTGVMIRQGMDFSPVMLIYNSLCDSTCGCVCNGSFKII